LQQNLQKFVTDFSVPDVQFGLYRARRDEAPCALTPVTQFFYPALNGNQLEFRRPLTAKAFQTNSLAVEEPLKDHSVALDPGRPTIIFCPAVAVDANGMRLGLGKGFYDRFFAAHPEVLRVGVVFHVQISAHPLPADSWDQELDWIVSEKMILRLNNRRSS
jgi:5-formyltetrahydrofolate cyclo-ligase